MSSQHKKYSNIDPMVRQQFINKVLSKQGTIKQAAAEFGIKFSTSKAILQTYRREGRIGKKQTRRRTLKATEQNITLPPITPLQRYQAELQALVQTNFHLIQQIMMKQQELQKVKQEDITQTAPTYSMLT